MTDETRGELSSGRTDWCDDTGRRAENSAVTGSVPPYSGFGGSADKVALQIDAGNAPPTGLLPTKFEGPWNRDALTLKSEFSFWTGSTFQSSESNPD